MGVDEAQPPVETLGNLFWGWSLSAPASRDVTAPPQPWAEVQTGWGQEQARHAANYLIGTYWVITRVLPLVQQKRNILVANGPPTST